MTLGVFYLGPCSSLLHSICNSRLCPSLTWEKKKNLNLIAEKESSAALVKNTVGKENKLSFKIAFQSSSWAYLYLLCSPTSSLIKIRATEGFLWHAASFSLALGKVRGSHLRPCPLSFSSAGLHSSQRPRWCHVRVWNHVTHKWTRTLACAPCHVSAGTVAFVLNIDIQR